MKKFLFLIAGIMLLAACNNNDYKPLYNISITGDADGQVDVSFPDGKFAIDGATNLAFSYGNVDSTVTFSNQADFSVEQGIRSANKDVCRFANDVKALDDSISATSAGGTYELVIDAKFYDPITGTEIHTHKVLSNRENEL